MTPLIIAHRGYSARAPENTLAAFEMAMADGADGVEFDVQLSKDGVPVVIHDFDLERVAGRAEKVAGLTAEELAAVNVGDRFYSGKKKAEAKVCGVPTLRSVLDMLPQTIGRVYVELKSEGPDPGPLASAVCAELQGSPLLDKVIVKSFRLAALPLVRHLLPQVRTAALFEPSIRTIIRRRRHMLLMASEFGADEISVHHSLVTRGFCRRAGEAGIPVTVWTVDDKKWLPKAEKLGITAIITNDLSIYQ